MATKKAVKKAPAKKAATKRAPAKKTKIPAKNAPVKKAAAKKTVKKAAAKTPVLQTGMSRIAAPMDAVIPTTDMTNNLATAAKKAADKNDQYIRS